MASVGLAEVLVKIEFKTPGQRRQHDAGCCYDCASEGVKRRHIQVHYLWALEIGEDSEPHDPILW